MIVNNESANTRMMRQHQLIKSSQNSGKLTEIDLGAASSVIDLVTSTVLNARTDCATLGDIVDQNPSQMALVSDADDQLIVKIVFKDACTISAIEFKGEQPPADIEAAPPKEVKFYANNQDLDFTDVDDLVPAQEETIEFKPGKAPKIVLKGNRFQKVQSLQIFIASNQSDAEATFVNKVTLWGFICPPYTNNHPK